MEKEKCNYCEKEAQYEQALEWVNIKTRTKTALYRYACEDHKDFWED